MHERQLVSDAVRKNGPSRLPKPTRGAALIGLQRSAGNRAVSSMLSNQTVQRQPATTLAGPVEASVA
ncbi:hypothetical protein [Lentzea atacamensis]|uniref:hypothetical protein n=1 Tax=Lentzea atacamensis TaxID=531938 RepID=UPI0011B76E0B|nr:hypothetical protein [Lentzea atacamensis]